MATGANIYIWQFRKEISSTSRFLHSSMFRCSHIHIAKQTVLLIFTTKLSATVGFKHLVIASCRQGPLSAYLYVFSMWTWQSLCCLPMLLRNTFLPRLSLFGTKFKKIIDRLDFTSTIRRWDLAYGSLMHNKHISYIEPIKIKNRQWRYYNLKHQILQSANPGLAEFVRREQKEREVHTFDGMSWNMNGLSSFPTGLPVVSPSKVDRVDRTFVL